MAGASGAGVKRAGVSPALFATPYALVGGVLAARLGAHWQFATEEIGALSEATAAVANELVPMLPAMEDNPLAAALAQLAITLGTVISTKYAIHMLITAQQSQAAAEAAAPASNVTPLYGA